MERIEEVNQPTRNVLRSARAPRLLDDGDCLLAAPVRGICVSRRISTLDQAVVPVSKAGSWRRDCDQRAVPCAGRLATRIRCRRNSHFCDLDSDDLDHQWISARFGDDLDPAVFTGSRDCGAAVLADWRLRDLLDGAGMEFDAGDHCQRDCCSAPCGIRFRFCARLCFAASRADRTPPGGEEWRAIRFKGKWPW